MKLSILFVIYLLLLIPGVKGQDYLVSGTVKDQENNESLIGVAVFHKASGRGAVTNQKGFYSIELPKGSQELHFSYLGYIEKIEKVFVSETLTLNLELTPQTLQTNEVVVTAARATENIVKTVDNIFISKEEIKKLPYLLGEVDPIKMLQLLPGVQSNGEGNNGIFVRGGGIDQNLILLDQAPVYNTGHLFGFFSLFNHSVINSVNLIKGGIPSTYGGRLSSVLEVNTRSGDFNVYKGEASIGVVAANLALEGPIFKGKSSFIVSGRRTYIDLMSKMVTNKPSIFNTGINYFFDDYNARLDFKITPKDKIAWSGYMGSDNFGFRGKNSLSNRIVWRNYTSSFSWDHFFNEDNFMTTTVFGSSYKLDFSAAIKEYVFSINSSIEDIGFKHMITIGSLKNHHITFGTEYIHHALVPNNIKAKGMDIDFTFTEQEKLNSQEQALFVHDEISIGSDFIISAGLRASSFQQLGPNTRYVSDATLNLVDTIRYGKGEIISRYMKLDPRIAITYKINDEASIKASFDRMHQYLHMAPVSSVSLPTDVWVSSSEKIKPQQGDQLSLGFFRNFRNNSYETSITSYYKLMSNQIEYRDGVIVGYSKGHNYDDSFISGTGKSYGLETFVRKNKGRLNGWISYTLSRTTRQFNEINFGQSFAAKYDRLHNLSIVNNYTLNTRWSLSGVFTYSTGNAMTLPVGRYIIGGNIINEYDGRNTFRMPAYHRMDVSATYSSIKRQNYQSFWVFSLYNLYNRKNPYYIYFNTEGNVNDYYLKVTLEKVSLFPIIPSIAYQIKF